ncbi:MAG: hypothetical protein H0W61_01270 [Bacteroidetes bacterium]|nr:hypothetical protein [Bacteroidota bacterium]
MDKILFHIGINNKYTDATNHGKLRRKPALPLRGKRMEAKEILQDVISKKPRCVYAPSAKKYLNDNVKGSYLVAKMYDDILLYPEASREVFGTDTCFKIIEFCRQN